MRVQIDVRGRVALVLDHPDAHALYTLNNDPATPNFFRVRWENDTYPIAPSGCAGGDACEVQGEHCVCDAAEETAAVLTEADLAALSAEPPAVAEAMERLAAMLPVGAPPPDWFDEGTYTRCALGGCAAAAAAGVAVSVRGGGGVDEDAIVELPHRDGALPLAHRYRANKLSLVRVGGGMAFRNPPSLMKTLELTSRDAAHETDAVIDHMFHHPNMAPFISRALIQRFTTSNPSPRYVGAVATAFRAGMYGQPPLSSRFSGTYGDLGATVAAVLLDREATSASLDLDPSHGQLREPVLKLTHLLRAMEFTPTESKGISEVDLNLLRHLGMESYKSPTVFNFYPPDYSPNGPLGAAGLVSPEAMLASAPFTLGFLNGVGSLIKYGLTECRAGLGSSSKRCSRIDDPDDPKHVPPDGHLAWRPAGGAVGAAAVVEQLDELLTAGLLNEHTAKVIREAYSEAAAAGAGADAALRVAQQLITAAPEFHATQRYTPSERERPPLESAGANATEDAPRGYKAVVVLFMAGGCDSFNLLVPHSRCVEADLYSEYRSVRGNVALRKEELLPINASGSGQPCEMLGLHPSLPFLKSLYDNGTAAMLANIGTLVEPITKAEYNAKQRTKAVPPNLFSHNDQQREVQSVHAQQLYAHGVLGRMLDAVRGRASPFAAGGYSLDGNSKMLEGQEAFDVVDKDDGVVRYSSYAELAPTLLKMVGNESSSLLSETYSGLLYTSLHRTELMGTNIEKVNLTTAFAADSISRQLAQVARLIATRELAAMEREAFFVQLGGFDMHNEVNESLAQKLGEVDTALSSFVAEMQALGVWEDTVVVSASDFGRTLTSNGLGTDHAWGGHNFVTGGAVKGGKVLGKYPRGLMAEGPRSEQILPRGRVLPTTGWEAVWNAIATWYGVDEEQLGTVLPNREKFGPEKLFSTGQLFSSA